MQRPFILLILVLLIGMLAVDTAQAAGTKARVVCGRATCSAATYPDGQRYYRARGNCEDLFEAAITDLNENVLPQLKNPISISKIEKVEKTAHRKIVVGEEFLPKVVDISEKITLVCAAAVFEE